MRCVQAGALHGAGLIMISKAFAEFFIERHASVSDYGFQESEAMTLAVGARNMQGGVFAANPCERSDADCAGI